MPTTPQKYVYIRTFGCQMNEHDSDKIKAILSGLGFDSTDKQEKANLILFNTCTIREKAHHKAISELGRSKIYKKGRAGVLIGVCGCAAQSEKEALFERYPHVDIIFGPDQISKLPDLIRNAETSGRASALDLIDDPSKYAFLNVFHESRITSHESRVSAFVSIMKGCNCGCTYCIVPKVRGREVSRPANEIINEVKGLADTGTKEVVLLGQNVNAYSSLVARRSSLAKDTCSFTELIRRIGGETSIKRIRFMSPHPKDVGDDLIREFRENEKLMPHIHLPAQAGSNSVLKKMGRGYTRERYIEKVAALKETRTGFSITTDLIVGFCGESDGDFNDTLDMMKTIEFDSVFAFKYSPRGGTVSAEKFKDDVEMGVKEKRLEKLIKFQSEISRRHNGEQIGKEDLVLATQTDLMKRGLVTGRLPDNRIVHFAADPSIIGEFVRVRVTGAHTNSLAAEVIK